MSSSMWTARRALASHRRCVAIRSARSCALSPPCAPVAAASSISPSSQQRSFASTNGYALRSALWIPTEKEVPADAAIPSHQLLLRGGFIRKSGHGVFAFLPLGKRVVSKLEAIIDDEMAAIQGNKLDLPLMIPAELWQQSGRWQTRGPELITFADRRDVLHALAPTHEESITSLVATHYNQNNSTHGANHSLRVYQVGKKFRDEIRPRFGLLRAREFVMKDMYSFDTSFERALETYEDVVRAYETILKARLKLPIAKVEADSGSIGGNLSHEFHVVADIGEDAILSCASHECGYAANVEKAFGTLSVVEEKAPTREHEVASGLMETLAQIQQQVQADDLNAWKQFLALSPRSGFTCKVLRERPTSDDDNDTKQDQQLQQYAIVFAREDREVNELSLKSFFSGEELEEVKPAALNAIDDWNAAFKSNTQRLHLFFDDSLAFEESSTVVVEALKDAAQVHADQALVSVHHGHFRMAQEGDGCPRCAHSHLEAKRGIEVGHVFYLGQKYSKPFDVTFTETDSESGQPVKKVMEMGCFGMGVTRLIASAVEVSHDKHGIIWPVEIAPYKVIVMAIGSKTGDEPISQTAIGIARELASSSKVTGLKRDDVILDDRWNESPGSKLAESELLGYPYRVVVGKRFAKEGLVEVQTRATLEKTFLSPNNTKSTRSRLFHVVLTWHAVEAVYYPPNHKPKRVVQELKTVLSDSHDLMFCRDCEDPLLEGSVELVFAIPNDGSFDLYNEHELKGKIAILTRGKVTQEPTTPSIHLILKQQLDLLFAFLNLAQKAGALAAVIFDSDQCDDETMHCHRHSGGLASLHDHDHDSNFGLFHDDPDGVWLPIKIPVAMISAEDGARIRSFMDVVTVEVESEMNYLLRRRERRQAVRPTWWFAVTVLASPLVISFLFVALIYVIARLATKDDADKRLAYTSSSCGRHRRGGGQGPNALVEFQKYLSAITNASSVRVVAMHTPMANTKVNLRDIAIPTRVATQSAANEDYQDDPLIAYQVNGGFTFNFSRDEQRDMALKQGRGFVWTTLGDDDDYDDSEASGRTRCVHPSEMPSLGSLVDAAATATWDKSRSTDKGNCDRKVRLTFAGEQYFVSRVDNGTSDFGATCPGMDSDSLDDDSDSSSIFRIESDDIVMYLKPQARNIEDDEAMHVALERVESFASSTVSHCAQDFPQ
ncbi:Proline-trna ligase, partial [Globisporangium splendens]